MPWRSRATEERRIGEPVDLELLTKAECRVERWQRRAKKDSTLQPRHQRRVEDYRDRLWHEPSDEATTASLTEECDLCPELQLVERPDIGLSDALNFREVCVCDRTMTEPRVDLLGGDGRRGDGDIDTDGAGRTHRVRRIADQQ